MQCWEYARFIWGGEDSRAPRRVGFTHADPWSVGADDYWVTLRRLGEEGWELVSTDKLPGDSQRPFTESWIMYFKRPVPEPPPGATS